MLYIVLKADAAVLKPRTCCIAVNSVCISAIATSVTPLTTY